MKTHTVRKTVVGVGLAVVVVAMAHQINDHPFPVGHEAPGGVPHSVRPAPVTQTPVAKAEGTD